MGQCPRRLRRVRLGGAYSRLRIFRQHHNKQTLYAEAKRLNDLGLATPGWRYGKGKKRPGAKLWSVMTVSNIVRQSAYSGVHRVKTNGGKDIIEQPVPAVVEPGLQERAENALRQNKRYPDRKNDRDYLLSGLIRCAHCGAWQDTRRV